MSYILNKTNGAVLTIVQDATIDLTTDLKFLGRNYAGYGEFQNENFIKLLENFANTTAPSKPIEGQVWYDTANKQLKFFDVTAWKGVGNIDVSLSNPSTSRNPSIGDMWYYTAGEQLYAYNGTEYILIGPPTGADKQAGWRGDYEQSAAQPGVPIYNIKAVIGADVIATVSDDEYTLAADASSNYPLYVDQGSGPAQKLYKGINLSDAHPVTGVSATFNTSTYAYTSGTILWGTAAHAIFASTATVAGSIGYHVNTATSAYLPVSFVTVDSASSGSGVTTLVGASNISWGFTYNPLNNYVRATRFEGVATSALYADLAERYETDAVYDEGTVLVIGGEKELTTTVTRGDLAVAGIVSKNPGLMMNSEAGNDLTHPYIALKGRVPCKVIGPVSKGDLLVTGVIPGHAEVYNSDEQNPNAVFAKALQNFYGDFGIIEVKL